LCHFTFDFLVVQWVKYDVLPAIYVDIQDVLSIPAQDGQWRAFNREDQRKAEKSLSKYTNGDWRTVARLLKALNSVGAWGLTSFSCQVLSYLGFASPNNPQMDVRNGLMGALQYLLKMEQPLYHPWDPTQPDMRPLSISRARIEHTLNVLVEAGEEQFRQLLHSE